MRLLLLNICVAIAMLSLVSARFGAVASEVASASPTTSADSRPPGDSRQAGNDGGAMRFVTVPVRIDPKGHSLAAYQFELVAEPAGARIVGLEGGGHAAFAEPPYYDPEALQDGERIIVAAFNTDAPEALPNGETRVATLHMMVPADQEPRFEVKLQAVADHEGRAIAAAITADTEGHEDE